MDAGTYGRRVCAADCRSLRLCFTPPSTTEMSLFSWMRPLLNPRLRLELSANVHSYDKFILTCTSRSMTWATGLLVIRVLGFPSIVLSSGSEPIGGGFSGKTGESDRSLCCIIKYAMVRCDDAIRVRLRNGPTTLLEESHYIYE